MNRKLYPAAALVAAGAVMVGVALPGQPHPARPVQVASTPTVPAPAPTPAAAGHSAPVGHSAPAARAVRPTVHPASSTPTTTPTTVRPARLAPAPAPEPTTTTTTYPPTTTPVTGPPDPPVTVVDQSGMCYQTGQAEAAAAGLTPVDPADCAADGTYTTPTTTPPPVPVIVLTAAWDPTVNGGTGGWLEFCWKFLTAADLRSYDGTATPLDRTVDACPSGIEEIGPFPDNAVLVAGDTPVISTQPPGTVTTTSTTTTKETTTR